VQPVNGKDLLLVPEHDRFKEIFYLYLDNKQFITNLGLEQQAVPAIFVNDTVDRLGVKYQVQQVQNWGSYTRCMMWRIDVGPNATPEVG